MKRHISPRTVALALFACLAFRAPTDCLADTPATAGIIEQMWMLDTRVAALHGDRSLLPKLLEELRKPHPYDYTITLLQAVARLGATEALPAIDDIIATDPVPYVKPHDQIARARLIAEAAVRSVTDPKVKARVKVERFYKELELTPEEINAQVRAYRAVLDSHPVEVPPVPLAVDAMGDLADMVYLGSYTRKAAQNYLSLPGIAGIDFSLFVADALKVRLAPLSRPERIRTLVLELGHRPVGVPYELEDRCKTQLLIDEGQAAAEPILKQLVDFDEHRADYQQHNEFCDTTALGDALESITETNSDYQTRIKKVIMRQAPQGYGACRRQFLIGY